MNALDLLANEHRTVLQLFDRYEASENDHEKADLARHIMQELAVHSDIEETIFYPGLRQKRSESIKDAVREGLEEHLSLKRLMTDLQTMNDQDPQFDAKMKVLREQLQHHVKEEEDEMFPEAQTLLSATTLKTYGEQMAERRAELEASADDILTSVVAEVRDAAP